MRMDPYFIVIKTNGKVLQVWYWCMFHHTAIRMIHFKIKACAFEIKSCVISQINFV